MNYCNIDEDVKVHLLNLIDWIYKDVISAGGDGDALWYSEYYNVEDIFPLVEEYNNKLKLKWAISLDRKKKLIYWGENQECILISNNIDHYNNSPSWQQVLIKY